MDEEKAIEQFAKDLERCQVYADIGGYQTDFKETARSLCYEGYRKAEEVRKETAKEILADLLGIIDEGYHRPQVNTTISSPFMNGENCAYKVVIFRMKQALKEKFGIEVGE